MARRTSCKKKLGLAKPVQKTVKRNKSSQQPKVKPNPTPKKPQLTQKTPKKTQKKTAATVVTRSTTVNKPKSQSVNRKKNTPTPPLTNKSKKAPVTKVQKSKSKSLTSSNSKLTKDELSKKDVSNSTISPSIFEGKIKAIYRDLEYTPEIVGTEVNKTNTSDELVTAIKEIAINKSALSPDLFESELEEAERKTPIEKVTVGTQCSPVVEKRITRDVEISTDQSIGIDVGVQTDPFESSFELPGWETIYDDDLSQFDDKEPEVEYYNSGSEDETSSSGCLDDFDTLDNLNVNEILDPVEQKTVNFDEQECTDEASTVSGSPPRNEVYRNRRFHSPDSLNDDAKQ